MYYQKHIEDILDPLAGANYPTVLDMKSGYHQLQQMHKQRTAFTVGPLGFYEYNLTPFVLVKASASYQRSLEGCLGDLHPNICFIYMEDLNIPRS